ncbi:MAG: hypothetical protein JO107_11290, partial [Hyphomicrobiales bacterium]|nr:hypothetical protein [Hyphomicrobiales bacterium]
LGGRWRFTKDYSVGVTGTIQKRWSNQQFNSFTQAIVGIDVKAVF